MSQYVRVTDAVSFFQKQGQPTHAVRMVRRRCPEKFRWRKAVQSLTQSAGRMTGRDRMRIEEPIREAVIEVPEQPLRHAIVLDARIHGVDLDRGEILPRFSLVDLKRLSFLAGTSLDRVQRHMPLPTDPMRPIDTGAAILVSSAIAETHRKRAEKLWGRLPGLTRPVHLSSHHKRIEARADAEAGLAKRWRAFAQALMDPFPGG